MARPSEKARNMMNKWVAMRDAGDRPATQRQRRPHLASECDNLADAERFRGELVRDIAQGIEKIQNPGLGEHAIRELNDEINKSMRTKWYWNKRIKELGGLDFNDIERKKQIEEGDRQFGFGYRYFGAAKDLPGVKELLEKEEAKRTKIKPSDRYKRITPDYYGWRDEDDGVLLELEDMAERKMLQARKKARLSGQGQEVASSVPRDAKSYLDIPSQEAIAKVILEEKKKALLLKYAL